MTVLGAIGDISRFATAKRLVGYAGLGAGVHDSGETPRDKGITKQGRRDLRRVMVEAAWTAVQGSPYWNAQSAEFERLTLRKHTRTRPKRGDCRHRPPHAGRPPKAS